MLLYTVRSSSRNRSERIYSKFQTPNSAFGMTLVELLIAVTFFALIIASSMALVVSSLRAQRMWGSSVRPYQSMERALSQFEQDLESAQPLFDVPFGGDPQHLEFARVDFLTGADNQLLPDWFRMVYLFEPDGKQLSLVRKTFLWRAGKDSQPLKNETLLSVERGQFSYGMLDENKKLVWSEIWDGKKDGLARLVKLDCLLIASGDHEPVAVGRIVRNPSGRLPQVETP